MGLSGLLFLIFAFGSSLRRVSLPMELRKPSRWTIPRATRGMSVLIILRQASTRPPSSMANVSHPTERFGIRNCHSLRSRTARKSTALSNATFCTDP